jgi:hypothetical protein
MHKLVTVSSNPRPSDAAREAWSQTTSNYLYRLKLDRVPASKRRGKTPVYQGSAYSGFEHGEVFRIYFSVTKHPDHLEVVFWPVGQVWQDSPISVGYAIAADYHSRTGKHMRQSKQMMLGGDDV